MDPGTRGAEADLRGLILLFTLGVLAAHALADLPPLPVLLLLPLPALLRWQGRAAYLAFVLGFIYTVLRADARLQDRWPAERHGEEVVAQGTVVSLPETAGLAQRFLFAPHTAGLPERIRVAWYRSEQKPRGGECWRLSLRLRTPHGSLNPGGFDYEGWLFSQGIGATATVREGEACGAPAAASLIGLRQSLADQLQAWLPAHRAQPLVAALVLGDRSGFRDADWEVFRRTGTTHLVAISGFNVGIVAAVAFLLGRWLWCVYPPLCLRLPAQRAGMVAAALAALAYALLAGFEPPVQRAVLMLFVLLAAAWLNRLTQPSRVLLLALGVILLLDPFAVLAPGLWLSFAAVAAIFYVSGNRLRAPGWGHTALKLQWLLAVALAPLTLFFFQGASAAAPLVNLLAVPFFALLTPWVLAAVVLALVLPAAGLPLLRLAADLGAAFLKGLEPVAAIPQLWLPASPEPAALLLALLGIILLLAPLGLPLRRLGILALVPLLFPPRVGPTEGFEVTALDVGQGLSVVVRTPQHALLYDAGPAFEEGFDAGRSVVLPYLLRTGVRRLDALMLSHGDNDHAGGVASVHAGFSPRREIGTPRGEPCVEGLHWRWDGVDFEVLHPPPIPSGRPNDQSCVLRVSDGRWALLLPGDIEKRGEQRLLTEHNNRLRSDLLLTPHHGSRTSSSPDFVAAVAPRIAIHAAGWRNRFDHPRAEVMARYAAVPALQRITGAHGAVRVRFGREGLQVEAWRERARRFWHNRASELPVPVTGLAVAAD